MNFVTVKQASDSRILAAHPTLVIGVPCFNEEVYLEKTLSSIAHQTWRDFAVLVCDNASTDSTSEIARLYCSLDPRFHYHRQDVNIGSGRNFNFILDHSVSRFIFWMGAHDLIVPEMVGRHLCIMEARPELSVSHSAHAWIDTEDRFIERVSDGPLDEGTLDDPSRYIRSIRENRNNTGANSVIRRSMLDDARFTDVVGTDRILLSHLAFRGPFANTEDILYLRRSFSTRVGNNPYMERLTGRSSETEDWTAFAREYDRDFAKLLGRRSDAAAWRRKLFLALRYYLPVERNSLLTRSLWTLRRTVKWSKRVIRLFNVRLP